MEDNPVDYSKSRFSIDYLLEKSDNRRVLDYGNMPSSSHERSETESPESFDGEEAGPGRSAQFTSGHSDRPKRPRTAFTSTQIKTLESEFEKNKYLSVTKRVELSRQLGLSQQQLKVWYQNRRTKWKRKYANDLESMAQQYCNSLGIPGSRPMLIGDRMWIFNSAQMAANEALMNEHPNMQRSLMGAAPLNASPTSILPPPRIPAVNPRMFFAPSAVSPFSPLNLAVNKQPENL